MKRLLATATIFYISRFPIRRGKVRLARIIHGFTHGVPLRTRLGPLLACRLNDSTFLQNFGEYQGFVEQATSQLREGDVFIDVGANIGMFSLAASIKVGATGHVYSFEPSMREYCDLVKNLGLNHVVNVTPFRIALSDSNAGKSIAISDAGFSGGSRLSDEPSGTDHEEPVTIMEFDKLGLHLLISERQNVTIKIDTEGCELRVLRGMKYLLQSRFVDRVIVEVDDSYLRLFGDSRDALYEFMEASGFSSTISNRTHHYDEIFIRNGLMKEPAFVARTPCES